MLKQMLATEENVIENNKQLLAIKKDLFKSKNIEI